MESSRSWTSCRVLTASSTSRPALWRRSLGNDGSRRMSWLKPGIEARELTSRARAGDELTGRLHLLRLDQFGLEAFLLGEIAKPDEEARFAVELTRERSRRPRGTRPPSRRMPIARPRRTTHRPERGRALCAPPVLVEVARDSWARRPRSHSRSARNIRCAASLASTSRPRGRATIRASGTPRRAFDSGARQPAAARATGSWPARSRRSSRRGRGAPRSMWSSDERSVEVGGDAADHHIIDADGDRRVGRDAGGTGDRPGAVGTTPGSKGSRIGALAGAPSTERRLDRPVVDREASRRSAGRTSTRLDVLVRGAVGCEQAIGRPGRARGPC